MKKFGGLGLKWDWKGEEGVRPEGKMRWKKEILGLKKKKCGKTNEILGLWKRKWG